MEASVRALFKRYQILFQQALKGDADMDEVASSYAGAFVAASPAGVNAGRNDDQLKQMMQSGFEYYRKIGTKEMRVRDVRVTPLDNYHCVAHVAWTASYERRAEPDVAIDFEVHYFVQRLGDAPKIFGWVSGDEQAVLKRHGVA